MKVFKTQLKGSATCVYREAKSVLVEVEDMLENMDANEVFTISVGEMTEEELNNLDEFMGY